MKDDAYEGEFIDAATLDDWATRDQEKNRRIKELEAEVAELKSWKRYWSGEIDTVLAGRADEYDRAEELERVCSEWAKTSQRNYQLAKRYHKVLKYICEPRFGLQGIIEDYGQDTDTYNYHTSVYYARLVYEYQKVAREAIAGVESLEDVLQDLLQLQHRDTELDAVIEENIERLYEE